MSLNSYVSYLDYKENFYFDNKYIEKQLNGIKI